MFYRSNFIDTEDKVSDLLTPPNILNDMKNNNAD